MSQGVTIKGKTASGQNIEVQVDSAGRLITSDSQAFGFAAWEVTSASSTEDLITYYDANNDVIRTILVTFTSTAKASISRVEVQ